jgi:hypothetical protein
MYLFIQVVLNYINTSDRKIEADVSNRVQKANQVYYLINNTIVGKREVSTKVKLQVYKTVFLPILIYGAETWTLLDKHESRITSAEMKYLRKIVGKTRRDRVRNATVREELQQTSAVETVEERQLRWYGHVIRMGEERKTRQVLEARPQGARRRGRPRKEWENRIGELAMERGLDGRQLRTLARNREAYRSWLHRPTLRGRRAR